MLTPRPVVVQAIASVHDKPDWMLVFVSAFPSQLLFIEVLRRSLDFTQYASHDYREALEQAGMTCSMSRRGNCWDDAVAESFFGTLKMELLYELPLQTRSATRATVADYIDTFYNVRRRHSSLDYMSPVEFELKHPGDGGWGREMPTPTA